MRREAGTFACAEHAIAVAYLMLAMPIEPKNPTQLICEALRDRFDATYERRELSGLSPHEWHAQAVFIVKLLDGLSATASAFICCGRSTPRASRARRAPGSCRSG